MGYSQAPTALCLFFVLFYWVPPAFLWTPTGLSVNFLRLYLVLLGLHAVLLPFYRGKLSDRLYRNFTVLYRALIDFISI